MSPTRPSLFRFPPVRAALRLAAAAGLAWIPAGAAGPLTLEQALEGALRHNRRLVESALDARRRELDLEAARSALDWGAAPFLQYTGGGDGTQYAYGIHLARRLPSGTSLGAAVLGLEDGDRRRAELLLEANQPLFRRFGSSVALEPVHAAGDRLRAALRAWEQRKADLALDLAVLFETVFRLDAQEEFELRFIGQLDRLAALSRVRERQGRANRADTLRVEIRRGEAEARLTNARERRAIAMRELAETLGTDPRDEPRLAPPPEIEHPMPDPEWAVALALDRRMDHAQALDDARSADRRDRLARRDRWPDLALSVAWRHLGGKPFDPADSGDSQWTAALSSPRLGARRADRVAQERAGLDADSAWLTVEWIRQRLAREVLEAIAERRRAEAELVIAERNRDLAEHGARLGRRLYALGRTDGLSADSAEGRLAESELRLFEARAARRIARLSLLHAMGLMIEHPGTLVADPAGGAEP